MWPQMTSRTLIKSGLYSKISVKSGKQRVGKDFRRLTTAKWVCRIYVLWKSMKYDPSSCVPWGYSRSSPVILRPTHDNSVSDYKIPIHLALQVIHIVTILNVTRTSACPEMRSKRPAVSLTDVSPSQYYFHLIREYSGMPSQSQRTGPCL